MTQRETTIREYASQAEGRFLELLEAVMAGSPELFAPGDKTIAIGHISDMCGDLFNEAIETASDADDAERYPDPDYLRDKMQGDADWEYQVGRTA